MTHLAARVAWLLTSLALIAALAGCKETVPSFVKKNRDEAAALLQRAVDLQGQLATQPAATQPIPPGLTWKDVAILPVDQLAELDPKPLDRARVRSQVPGRPRLDGAHARFAENLQQAPVSSSPQELEVLQRMLGELRAYRYLAVVTTEEYVATTDTSRASWRGFASIWSIAEKRWVGRLPITLTDGDALHRSDAVVKYNTGRVESLDEKAGDRAFRFTGALATGVMKGIESGGPFTAELRKGQWTKVEAASPAPPPAAPGSTTRPPPARPSR